MNHSAALTGILMAIIAAVFWGISGTFGQFLFQERNINVEWLITVRLLASGVLLLLFSKAVEKENIGVVWKDRKDSIKLLIFSITGIVAIQYTYFAAINHSNAATATVLQYVGPIIIAVYLAVKHHRPPKPKELVAIFLAVAGTFLLVTHGEIDSLAISPIALFWGLSSAVALAVYTLQPLPLLAKYKSTVVIGWGMLCGGLCFSIIKAPWRIDGIWDFFTVLSVIVIVVFGTVVAFTFYSYAVKTVGGQKASLLASAEPLSATLLAVFWLQTPFLLMDWIGSLCIISTIFLLSKKEKGD